MIPGITKIAALIIALAAFRTVAFSDDIIITNPADGDYLIAGETVRITWSSDNGYPVDLFYIVDDEDSWNIIAQNVTTDYYDWTVPYLEETNLKIRALEQVYFPSELLWEIDYAANDEIRVAEFYPDATVALTGSVEGRLRIRDVDTRETIDSVGLPSQKELFDATFFKSKDSVLVCVDSTVYLWDRNFSQSGNILRDLTQETFDNLTRTVSAHPTERLFCVGSDDGDLVIFDFDTRTPIFRKTASGRIYCSAFSSGGDLVAFSGGTGEIEVWNWRTDERVGFFVGHGESGGDLVWSVNFSRDESMLVSCGVDRTVRVWDLASGDEISNIVDGTRHLRDVEFHPSGGFYFSAGLDGNLRQRFLERTLFDVETMNHGGSILAANYSPTGDSILTVGRDRSVKLWKNFSFVGFDDTVSVGLKYPFTVYIPDLKQIVGDYFETPIFSENADKIPEIHSSAFSATIKVGIPKYLMNPENNADLIETSERKDTLLIRINSLANEKLAGFYSTALLGDRFKEDIPIFEIIPDQENLFEIEKKDGSIELITDCYGEKGRNVEISETTLSVAVNPNPASETARISYSLIEDGLHELEIIDEQGKVITLFRTKLKPGIYEAAISIDNLPNGAYFVKLRSPSEAVSTKLLIAK